MEPKESANQVELRRQTQKVTSISGAASPIELIARVLNAHKSPECVGGAAPADKEQEQEQEKGAQMSCAGAQEHKQPQPQQQQHKHKQQRRQPSKRNFVTLNKHNHTNPEQQVDQGAAYLYAFNEFLHSAGELELGRASSSSSSGNSAESPVARLVDDTNPHQSSQEPENQLAAKRQRSSAAADDNHNNHLRQYLQIEESFNKFKARQLGANYSDQQPADCWRDNNQDNSSQVDDVICLSAHSNHKNQNSNSNSNHRHQSSGASPELPAGDSAPVSSHHQQQQQQPAGFLLPDQRNLIAAPANRKHKPKKSSFIADSSAYLKQLTWLPGADYAMYSHQQHHQQQQQPPAGSFYSLDSDSPPPQQRRQLPAASAHQFNVPHHAHPLTHHAHPTYPQSGSDSSLGSSGAAFVWSSNRRSFSSIFQGFCSKRCLFTGCLLLVVFLLLLVGSLSAYLNFLITANKPNMQPLSGRFRVSATNESELLPPVLAGSNQQLQQRRHQFETILRGAFERVDPKLRSYSNHLVKLEVYSLRPSGVAPLLMLAPPLSSSSSSFNVYFRLFLNKRTLALDPQLMRTKLAPDSFERSFLPKLSQLALVSGLEQLQRRSSSQPAARSKRDDAQLRSFDDQIQRLMPIINSIDLQSVQISPEFDMQQTTFGGQSSPLSNQLVAAAGVPPTSSGTSSSGSGSSSSTQRPAGRQPAAHLTTSTTPTPATTQTQPEESTQTQATTSQRKFTILQNYRDNTTRPAAPPNSTFLVHQAQPKPSPPPPQRTTTQLNSSSNSNSNQTRPATPTSSVRATDEVGQQPIVRLVSGQPVVSQANGRVLTNSTRNNDKRQQVEVGVEPTPSSESPLVLLVSSPAPPAGSSSELSVAQLWSNALGGPAAQPSRQQQQQQRQRATQLAPSSVLLTAGGVEFGAESTSRPPKVSPHLKLAGALQQSAGGQQQQPQRRQPAASSAIVLSRDVAPATNQTARVAARKPQQPQVKPKVQPTSARANNSSVQQQQQQPPKPSGGQQPHKLAKVKKVATSSANQNGNSTRPPAANEPNRSRQTAPPPPPLVQVAGFQSNGTVARPQHSNSAELLHFVPTLATTLDLTRSTSSAPLVTPTPRSSPAAEVPAGGRERELVDFLANQSQQLTRPGTTNFSGQWRPLASNQTGPSPRPPVESSDDTADGPTTSGPWTLDSTDSLATPTPVNVNNNNNNNPTSSRRPNLSLIISTERLPVSLNVASAQSGAAGSQGPFAMPPMMFGSSGATDTRPPRPFTTRFRPASSSSQSTAQRFNDFEPHRMSRMRQPSNGPIELAADQFGGSSASDTTPTGRHFHEQQQHHRHHESMLSSTSSSSSSSSSTTMSSSDLGPATGARIVDDFMITTAEPGGESSAASRVGSSTLVPPMESQPEEQPVVELPMELVEQRQAAAANSPRRTRGPFAFETLHGPAADFQLAASSPAPTFALAVSENPFELLDSLASTTAPVSRLERSHNSQPATENSVGGRQQQSYLDERQLVSKRLLVTASEQCEHFGCRPRGAASPSEFVCLNASQLCDDSIDCHDQSDELDCVSLMRRDSASSQLTASNGAGIIYLNRRGHLAPMCIDHLATKPKSVHAAAGRNSDSDSDSDDDDEEPARRWRQQELIRQINTIGQYACSLQSFDRLASVKINHHDLVDGSNLIRASKLFHQLSVSAANEQHFRRRQTSDASQWPSGATNGRDSNYAVGLSTSAECPSKRTVFVKCGGFQCGQSSQVAPNLDFAQVQLRRFGVLICRGFLIDELWLLTSADCFEGSRQLADGWTAELADGQQPAIVDVLQQTNESPIVLAKLDKPVRFSPSSRPICLPQLDGRPFSWPADSQNNGTSCVSVKLSMAGAGINPANYRTNNTTTTAGAKMPTRRQLIASPVRRVAPAQLCLEQLAATPFVGRTNAAAEAERQPSSLLLRDLICVEESTKQHTANEQPADELNELFKITNNNKATTTTDGNDHSPPAAATAANDETDDHDNGTRVLICSSNQASRLRPTTKWTVVGVQDKSSGLRLRTNKRLYATVSRQIDWIIDTINPKQEPTRLVYQYDGPSAELELAAGSLLSANGHNNATCNQFKCSTGECLSWSRICDGLYDCSSHEDEEDCHRRR